MKNTIWRELDAERCEIVDHNTRSIRIAHPDLKRPRYFVLSRKGNWYSRYTGKGIDTYAEGVIIKGLQLDCVGHYH